MDRQSLRGGATVALRRPRMM